MQTLKKFFSQTLIGVGALVFSGVVSLAVAQQATSVSGEQSGSPSAGSTSGVTLPSDLPDSPGATLAKAEVLSDRMSNQTSSSGSSASSDSANTPAQSPPQNQTTPQKPVGTAAAEAPDTTGIAASQPAGAAIAPAKQRRVRTLVIKVGAIVGAAVAVGTIVALTEATSSKPPGAH